jgi:plastocyanin
MKAHQGLGRLIGAAALAAGAIAWVGPGVPAGAATLQRVKIVPSGGSCTSEFCFTPATPTVTKGETVKWNNKSAASHQLALCTIAACGVSSGTGTDTGFGSAVLSPGQKYSFTFHHKGTYTYYCTIHGYAIMHGTITVSG